MQLTCQIVLQPVAEAGHAVLKGGERQLGIVGGVGAHIRQGAFGLFVGELLVDATGGGVEVMLHDGNHVVERAWRHGAYVADVIAPTCGIGLQHLNDGVDEVVDIGEVAPHVAMVAHSDGLAPHDALGKYPGCHIGAAVWTIDREEA